MKTDNNIDRYFRENLYDFQETPPEGVWDKIDREIKKSSKRIVIPMYIKVAAGIILIASLASILWRVTREQDTSQKTIITEKTGTAEKISEKTEIAESIHSEESKKHTLQSQRSESSLEKYPDSTMDEANVMAEKTGSLSPIETQKGQEEIETVTIPIEPDMQTTLTETDYQISPSAESTDNMQNEPKAKVDKNDLIIQQNQMVLEESTEKSFINNGSRWSIGGQAGPQYSYRDVSVNPGNPSTQNYDQFEDGMLAFAGGINVQVQAANRFSIQSGVYYSKIGQEVSSLVYGNENYFANAVANEPNTAPSIGTLAFAKDNRPPTSAPEQSDNAVSEGSFLTEQQFEFVEIPLVFKYFVVDRKLDISLNGGLWTNILVGNTAITTGNDYYVKEETKDINKFNYSGSLGVGFNYPVTSNLLISLDPIFKYYLSPINSNPETEVHPYTFGIMTGINFSF